MSYMSTRSVSSGTCSNSSHWSTSAPLTPNYFPDPLENPIPQIKPGVSALALEYDDDAEEIMQDDVADVTATPTRRTDRHRSSRSPTRDPASASTSPFDLATPTRSPSIHQYSSALRETMRKRYDEAFKRMTNGDGKMVEDLSWEDEDPIERHVRMTSIRADAEAKVKAARAESSARGFPLDLDPMLGRAGPSSEKLDDGLPPPRPTLLDFRGFSHLNTGRSDDDTPGSMCSESSFEGGSREDWVDMYGRSQSADKSTLATVPPPLSAPLDSPSIIVRLSRASISTNCTTDTSSSQSTIMAARSALTPGLAYLQPDHSPSHLFQPLPTPAPMSSLATGYFAIPTQTVPAPVSRSYPKRPTMGTRQRSRNHPYANALEKQKELSSTDVRLITGTSAEEEYPERSESELLVLRAGLRSQRSRAAGRV